MYRITLPDNNKRVVRNFDYRSWMESYDKNGNYEGVIIPASAVNICTASGYIILPVSSEVFIKMREINDNVVKDISAKPYEQSDNDLKSINNESAEKISLAAAKLLRLLFEHRNVQKKFEFIEKQLCLPMYSELYNWDSCKRALEELERTDLLPTYDIYPEEEQISLHKIDQQFLHRLGALRPIDGHPPH